MRLAGSRGAVLGAVQGGEFISSIFLLLSVRWCSELSSSTGLGLMVAPVAAVMVDVVAEQVAGASQQLAWRTETIVKQGLIQ